MTRLLALLATLLLLLLPDLGLAAPASQVIILNSGAAVSLTNPLPVTATFSPSGTQDVNLKQVNGATTTAFGSGVTGTETQRVTLATNVALPTGTNVIGHVINDTGSTTAVTGNVTVVQPTGTNLHAVLDTTSTTAVTQATASNLNAAVVGVGTAGAASGGVLTIQGVAAMTKLLVTPDSVALPANQSVNVAQINGVTPLMGNGVVGTGSPRVAIADIGTGEYETVAASQTNQALGASGATGDYLLQLVCVPATTSPGVVTVLDNAIAIVSFPGGASSVSNLLPFTIPVNAYSVSGAWKVTTGANISCVGVGNFT